MCGRLTQVMSVSHYRNELGMPVKMIIEALEKPVGDYNVLPGVKHWVLRIWNGELLAEQIVWQYQSEWARREGKGMQINARLDKLLGGFYRGMMKTGRVIVPVDGWYEWTASGKDKQPWHIRRKDKKPMFVAALTNHFPEQEDPEGAGFVIVTNESAGGMVDIHDRRPVIFDADDAKLWMDLSFDFKQAEMLARERSLPVEAFEWYRVSRDVNAGRYHGPNLIDPLFPDEDRDVGGAI